MNRQVFPAALFPLRGDISAEAGATSVTVQGIQGIPVQDAYFPLANYDTMFYNSTENIFYFANPWEIPVGQVLEFEGYGYNPAGISWLAPDTIAIGDGTQGDVSGAAAMTALILFGSAAYYSSYDLFHTTIYSGATENWNLVLPETPGSSGQVLTTNGLGFTYWTTPSSGGGTPGGSTGDIQFNNGGVFAGSAATITSAGSITIPDGQAFLIGTDTSISRISGGLVAIGSGTPGSETGGIILNTINLGDQFYDSTDYSGASGWVLSSTGTKTAWINPTTSLNAPGSTGDILFNNGGVVGASSATINAAGSLNIPVGQVLEFTGSGYTAAGLSWLASDTLAIGNGNEGDVSGGLGLTALILFGSSSYSDYDLFHTTIYSGATTDWTLILPETSGAAGQVLTIAQGTGNIAFTEWAAPSLPWSSLTNPTGNLVLSMGTDTTTFNQTSNIAWLWANTTVASAITTNDSPLLKLAANYWTGSASSPDSWQVFSSLVAGTNGVPSLNIQHAGSTGTQNIRTNANIVTLADTTLGGSGNSTIQTASNLVLSSTGGGAIQLVSNSDTITFSGSNLALPATCHLGSASADVQGQVSSAPSGIVATKVVVAVGAATATFTVTSTEGFTTGDTVTLSATGWTAGSGLASSTATVTTVSSTTAMILTRVSGGPWVAGTYTAQTGTLTQTGGTSVSVIYAVAYTSIPTVVVTPTSNAGAFYLSASSTTGFTITYASSGTQTFNYIVIGNPS